MSLVVEKEMRVYDQEPLTYADLLGFPPDDRYRYELIDGVLYMSPSPHARRHQRAVGNLYFMLRLQVEGTDDLGKVFLSPTDVVVRPNQVFVPDLFVIRADRMHLVDAVMEAAPDWVIEVASPSTARYDRTIKFEAYAREGVTEYWIVDPIAQTVAIFLNEADGYQERGVFHPGDIVTSGAFPTVQIPVDDVFAP